MLKAILLAVILTAPVWADTGFNPPAVLVSTDDAHAITKGVQKIILSTGTTVSISGSIAKVSVSTNGLSGLFILNQVTLQSGATFYVSSGTVNGLFTVNGNMQTYGDTIYHRGSGIDLQGPNDLGVGYIYNPNNSLSSLYLNAIDGVATNGAFSAPSLAATYGVAASTISVSTITVSGEIKFNNRNCLATAPDGTCILSSPETQSLFWGYNTNLINSGGVFNTAYGTTAIPYPGGGNFNTCIGNSCMSGSVITTAENNNAMGYGSCGALRAGFYNNCMGGSSGNGLRDGNYNTFVGTYAGTLITDENGLTHVGFEAGRHQLTGPYVTAIGYQAGEGTATVNANTTGASNTYIGRQTGQDIASATTINNSFAIGVGALVHASNEGQLGGRNGSGFETLTRTSSMTVESTLISNSLQTGSFSKYNAISTVSNGVPTEYATIDTTGLTANVGASTLYAVPATGAGMYRISSYTVETTAGSISSTLPNVQIVYTDKETGGAITIDATPVLGVAGIGQTGALTSNTVGTASSGVIAISVKASTTIQYQTVNYASNLAGMAYAIHLKLEAL